MALSSHVVTTHFSLGFLTMDNTDDRIGEHTRLGCWSLRPATTNFGQNEQNSQNPDFVRFCEFCLKSFVFISVDSWLLELVESPRGSDSVVQTARPQSTQHIRRLFPRLGAGRVRFFSAHVRDRADGARFRHEHRRSQLRDHAHAGDAPGWRVHLWTPWRSIRAAHPAHARHHFLFVHGIAYGVFSELHNVADFPRALWNRHGRRMGTGRVVSDGNLAD